MTLWWLAVGYWLLESDNGLLFNRRNVQEETFFFKISTIKIEAAALSLEISRYDYHWGSVVSQKISIHSYTAAKT
jgi:hypothetical protein